MDHSQVKERHHKRDQLDRIPDACPDLTAARDLANEFSTIARERRGHDLTAWMTRALDHGPPPVQGASPPSFKRLGTPP
ncbi:hypothetical protein [Streptomyces sp. NPDC041003]|uniref:hypothetical protein n=1 Tax=Streptomyces sp. NPDC041003 TaxID=3155730 RepID=UPI0033C6C5F5